MLVQIAANSALGLCWTQPGVDQFVGIGRFAIHPKVSGRRRRACASRTVPPGSLTNLVCEERS
jgi:hypothetical protein